MSGGKSKMKKLILTRPADKSLDAYKAFMQNTFKARTGKDFKLTEKEWTKDWKEFWNEEKKTKAKTIPATQVNDVLTKKESPTTHRFYTRPADKSLQAYKNLLTGAFEAMNKGEKAPTMTEAEWIESWKKFLGKDKEKKNN